MALVGGPQLREPGETHERPSGVAVPQPSVSRREWAPVLELEGARAPSHRACAKRTQCHGAGKQPVAIVQWWGIWRLHP